MSYIIYAEVRLYEEMNFGGDIKAVNANVLSMNKQKDMITFDICGEFGKQRELTKKLCNTLIDAGFCDFSIRHSY